MDIDGDQRLNMQETDNTLKQGVDMCLDKVVNCIERRDETICERWHDMYNVP